MEPEADLLDQLCGGDLSFPIVEQIFKNDRSRALKCAEAFVREGLIEMKADGLRVPEWRLADWRRRPLDTDTAEAIQRVTLSLTDAGLDRL
jgi:hypothetical protein